MPRQFEVLIRVRIEAASQNLANELAIELSEVLDTKLREQGAGGQIEALGCYPVFAGTDEAVLS